MATGAHVEGSVLPDVPAAATTAHDLAEELVLRRVVAPGNVRTLLDPRDPVAFGEAVTAVAEEADSVLIVYYVGHGLVGLDGRLYLATAITDHLTRGLEFKAFPYAVLRAGLAASRARSIVLVLDCCFSGRAGPGFGGVAGLFDQADAQGGFVLASAAPEELALAPEGERHTAFSDRFLRLLREGDPGGPPLLTWDHAFRYLSRHLRDTGFPPPHRQSRDRAGELVLAVNEAYQLPSEPSRPVDPEDEDRALDICPFQGLASFGADDARYFFGRDRLVTELVERLSAQLAADGPVMVVGPSGAGKSSLLRAGLRPSLDRGLPAAPQVRGWPHLLFNPGEHPVRELARALGHTFGGDPQEIQTALTEDPQSITSYLRRPGMLADGRRLVLVIDQFEELFTLCVDERQREVFVEGLAAACTRTAEADDPPAVVILGLRADFYGHCGQYPALVDALREAQVLVSPMTTGELRDVIEKPAYLAGLALEPGLVDLLLRDLRAGGPGAGPALPLLSHALLSTWQKRVGRTLTMAGYEAAGGIWDAVARTAEGTHDRLDEDGRVVLRRVLLRMVRLGDDAEDSRRRVPLTEFHEDGPAAPTVLDALVQARLVTVDSETAELSHDALLRAWPRLKDWIEADRAGLLVRQRLHEAAEAWERDGHDPDALYRGVRLDAAQQWFEEFGHVHGTTAEARAFLEASIAQAHAERRAAQRRTTRLRLLAGTLGILLVAAVAGAGTAIWQRRMAAQQRDLLASKAASVTADRLRDTDPRLALQLALAARRVADTPEARTSLHHAALAPYDIHLDGHTAAVARIAYHPGRHLLVSTADDHTVRLWDISEPNRPRTTAVLPTPAKSDVVLSPDGRLLLAGQTGTAQQLWNVADPNKPVALGSLGIGPSHAAFSANGRTLLALNKETLTLWDLTDPGHPVEFSTLPVGLADVRSVSLSADDRTFAAAIDPGDGEYAVRLWNVTDPRRPVATITLPDTHALSVAFSPRTPILAIGNTSTGVELWDTTDPTRPTQPHKYSINRGFGAVAALKFNPDGHTLAAGVSAVTGNRIELLDVSDPASPKSTAEYPEPTLINQLVFGDDPETVFSIGEENSFIRLWRPALNTLWPVEGAVDVREFTHSDSQILVLPKDTDHGEFTLWRANGLRHPQQVGVLSTGTKDPVVRAVDDRLLVEFSWKAPARLWDITDPAHPVPRASLGRIGWKKTTPFHSIGNDLTIAGHTIAVNTDDDQIHLWDVANPAAPVPLSTIPQPDVADSIFFIQDGRTLAVIAGAAVGQANGDILFWDVTDPRRPTGPTSLGTDHIAQLNGFDSRLAAVGDGPNLKPVRLWDISDPAHPVAGTLPPSNVRGLAMSPDEHTLATATNNSIDLWNIEDVRNPVQTGHITVDTPAKLAFSPDSRLVVAESGGGSRQVTFSESQLQLWDVTDPARVTEVAAPTVPVYLSSAGFSPDSNTLYITGNYKILLLDPNVDSLTRRLCEASDGPLSPGQRRQYFPGTPYDPPCQR
ncbi:caspase, EACC1-associated type [Micromonospora sonchi]|uniref:caspase, EACC1-associated type n=1 Tax=Micromonospora sonchi TaxID=1763543 RepID=UPI001663DC77|nr:AAA family ATPase [Micromonospora sonchi]